MSVNADALTSLENLKASLKITNTTDDAYLEQLINRATWQVEGDARRKSEGGKYGFKARRYNGLTGGAATLGAHPTTLVLDEDYVTFSGSTTDKGGDTLINPDTGLGEYHLPAYPVQANSVLTFALAILSQRGSAVSGNQTWDTTSYVEFDQYVVDRERGALKLLGGTFEPGILNYRITMAAGYQVGSNQPFVPYDLEQLCVEYCKKLWLEDDGVTSESLGTWSRSYDLEKSQEKVARILERYSRFSV
jgi:hypothetical protein